jgi:ATP-dependent helicase/nuclease subunit A
MPNIDAVSLSTMHGAKGLEAKVVVLAGLLDREKSDSGLRWLIDWNANRDAIQHLTTWQPGDPFNEAVIKALGEEGRQSRDEDFNLLYVGVTRAKNILLFSATKGKKDFLDTWFGRIMDYCDAWDFGSASVHDDPVVSAVNAHWPGLLLPKRERDDSPVSTAETLAIRKGKALHRLLEFGTRLQPQLAARLIAEFALPRQSEAEVMEAVDRIGSTEFGQTIFDPGLLAYAEQEWPLDSEQGTLMRPDRVVRVACSPECWWIIDFKWQVLETEQDDYAIQLATYQSVFQRIRPQAQVSAKIITAEGNIWELQLGSGQNRICRIPDALSRSPGEFAG